MLDLNSVNNFIKKNQLLNPQDKILIGFSGGADSVVLTHILLKLKFKIALAHCNFMLRGEESIRDENFAKKFAEKFNLNIYIKKCDARKFASENNFSVEMSARKLRYDFFYTLLEKEKFDKIAIAHNSDDNIETLLINLSRKTGLKGLLGIPVKNDKIIRPLLFASKKEILEYAQKNNLNFVVDSTNLETEFLRNKIRHIIIPEFEKINPLFKQNVLQTIENLKDYYGIVADFVEKIEKKCLEKDDFLTQINLQCLKSFKHHKIFLKEFLQKFGFSIDNIEKLANSLDKQSGLRFEANDFQLVKDRKVILIWNKNHICSKTYKISSDVEYFETEKNKADFIKLKFIKKETPNIIKDKNLATVDFDKIKFPLFLRKWKKGDFFIPLGMKGKKKLSDFFNDNKFSAFEKQTTWILTDKNDEIIWIVGHRINDKFKITDKTTKTLIIKKL